MTDYSSYYMRLLKTHNSPPWWLSGGISSNTCAFAYQPKGASSLADSYINLNNPGTNNAVVVPTKSAPTWDATNGWTFDGSTQLLRNSAAATTENGFLIIRFSNMVVDNAYLCGFSDTTTNRMIILNRKDLNYINYRIGSASVNKAPYLEAGVLGFGASDAYRNGVDEELTLAENTGDRYIGFGGLVTGSGAAQGLWGACYIQAAAYYTTEPSAAQVLALSTAMAAL